MFTAEVLAHRKRQQCQLHQHRLNTNVYINVVNYIVMWCVYDNASHSVKIFSAIISLQLREAWNDCVTRIICAVFNVVHT